MKFCDEKIQKHLLNGGKVKRPFFTKPIYYNDYSVVFEYNDKEKIYCLNKVDLAAYDWEIVEPEYDWDKIIKDKVLCIFSNDENFDSAIISTLKRKDESYFYDARSIWFMYCKPIKASDYNIINNLKEYEL